MTGKKQKATPRRAPSAPRSSTSELELERTSEAAIRQARLAGIRGSVERQIAPPPPRELMSGVSWCFHTGRARGLAEFVREVTEYNDEDGDGSWSPTQVVVRAPLVRVAYDADQDAKTLRSTSPTGFTMADLLYQIHNHYYRELADADNAFFEGLELDDEGPPPFYVLRLGS